MKVREIKNRISEKLGSTSGESIAETLISLLIIVLAMLMLAGSLVAAEKVNKRIKDSGTAFSTIKTDGSEVSSKVSETEAKVKIEIPGVEDQEVNVNVIVYTTQDDDHYVYYEEKENTPSESQ